MDLAQEIFLFFFIFFIKNMESIKSENNTIEHNKQVLNLIIKEFRELIDLYRFRTDKISLKMLRKALRKREKIVCDGKEDDIEYLKNNIEELKDLKNNYFNKNKSHDYGAKYLGTDETIRYLFEDYKYTRLTNNISHFLIRLYYHLINT